MNEIIVRKLSHIFLKNNIVSIENKEYFEYGLYLIVSSLTTFFSIMLLSIFFNKILVSLLFSFTFFITRSICGGYHCKTSLKCFITSVCVYLLFISGTFLPQNSVVKINYIIMITGALIIFIFAPVVNINNPVSDSRKKNCKIISSIICIISIVLLLVLNSDKYYQIVYVFSYSLFITGIMIIIEKINHLVNAISKS